MDHRKRNYVIGFLVIGVMIYLFRGPLFPWCPVKFGYRKVSTASAKLYIQNFSQRDSAIFRLEKIIAETEQFHDLKYMDDFKIIILDEDSNMKRFLPWMRGSGYSVSLSLANVIYIGPTARRSPRGIESYLRHELSHLLIDQNTTFKKALKIHEQGWLAEGVAEYFSGRSFFRKSELMKFMGANNFSFTHLYEKNPLKMSLREVKFKYTFYRFLIEYLIESYGISKFHEYLKIYIEKPDNYKELFVEIYVLDLTELLKGFQLSFADKPTGNLTTK